MLLKTFIFVLLLILKVNSLAHDHFTEQLAALILSVADNEGNLLIDPNNPNKYLILDKENSNDLSIVDIIPTLDRDYIELILKNENINNPTPTDIDNRIKSEFKELHQLALEVFKGKFTLESVLQGELQNKIDIFNDKLKTNDNILSLIENYINNKILSINGINDDANRNKIYDENFISKLEKEENINIDENINKMLKELNDKKGSFKRKTTKLRKILKNIVDGNDSTYDNLIDEINKLGNELNGDLLNTLNNLINKNIPDYKDFNLIKIMKEHENKLKIYNRIKNENSIITETINGQYITINLQL